MAGTTNFVQQNPGAANQQSDGTYAAYALTTGGVGVNDILPSPWLNKIWYQGTTFVAALAAVMAGWGGGFTITDTSISTLQTNMIAFFNYIIGLGTSKFSNPTDVTGSRAYNTQYQNTNTTALFVNATGNINLGVGHNASAVAYIGAVSASQLIDGNTVANGPGYAGVGFFVPPGWYYEIQTHVGADTDSLNLQAWTESL